MEFCDQACNSQQRRALVAIKVLHTAVWCAFVTCIVGIWIAAARKSVAWGAVLSGAVLIECAILVLNGGRCPLTDVAARYTQDRRGNFDIYLPNWLATRNKWIFGSLFAGAEVYLAVRYLM